jgi:hypothetical protein
MILQSHMTFELMNPHQCLCRCKRGRAQRDSALTVKDLLQIQFLLEASSSFGD